MGPEQGKNPDRLMARKWPHFLGNTNSQLRVSYGFAQLPKLIASIGRAPGVDAAGMVVGRFT